MIRPFPVNPQLRGVPLRGANGISGIRPCVKAYRQIRSKKWTKQLTKRAYGPDRIAGDTVSSKVYFKNERRYPSCGQ